MVRGEERLKPMGEEWLKLKKKERVKLRCEEKAKKTEEEQKEMVKGEWQLKQEWVKKEPAKRPEQKRVEVEEIVTGGDVQEKSQDKHKLSGNKKNIEFSKYQKKRTKENIHYIVRIPV